MEANEQNGNGEFIQVMTGRVKHFKISYGFITPDDANLSDVFVHFQQIEPWREGFRSLSPGDIVKFELWRVKPGPRGYQARNVEIKRDPPKMTDFQTGVPEDFGNRRGIEREENGK